uniref:Dual specificity phosphatase 1 n=1 Tax=Cyanistes caeruleus TaxID=156563 RepID=A0A8C0U2V0_CYACU
MLAGNTSRGLLPAGVRFLWWDVCHLASWWVLVGLCASGCWCDGEKSFPSTQEWERSSRNLLPAHWPVEILPFLYLGSAYHASRKDMLDALGITALINVSANCPNHFEGHYQYKSIPVEDNHKADISSWFNEAIDFIDSVKNEGGRVFVHCQAGISRSATICLAYLMRTNRVKLDEAFEFVKQRRSIISPNFSFMGQLLQYLAGWAISVNKIMTRDQVTSNSQIFLPRPK